jgi:type II secretory pathway pseudopilin PulG
MRRQTGGFTLVETIFSTLFISMTVLAIVNLFPGAYMSTKKAETRLQSDIIAQSIIEDLRNTAFTQPPFVSLGDSVPNSHTQELDSLEVDGTRYFPTVTVYNLADTDPKIVKGVRVEVAYQTSAGNKAGVVKIHDGTKYYPTQRNVHDSILHSLK